MTSRAMNKKISPTFKTLGIFLSKDFVQDVAGIRQQNSD